MFQKQCPMCGDSFESKDRRQMTCGSLCASQRRKQTAVPPATLSEKLPQPVTELVKITDLPPPDQLPAPYAKRVYEMWRSLTGDSSAPSRIA